MVGGWVILGLIFVQLKLEIELGQNFGLFSVSIKAPVRIQGDSKPAANPVNIPTP